MALIRRLRLKEQEMSILIKGMNKPEECYCCPCSTINMNGRWGKCNLLGRDYSSYPHGIYEDCPLVEIQPHGRLIDADKLCEYARNSTVGIDANDICRFPCVIGADEQENSE